MIGITNINPRRVPIQRGESFIPLSLDLLSRLRCFCHFETSSLKSDEARPGRSRFENVSNGVELAALRRDATKSLTAITGTMVKNGHLRTKVLSACRLPSRVLRSASHGRPFLSALTASPPLSG
jgi:hypothetical protein